MAANSAIKYEIEAPAKQAASQFEVEPPDEIDPGASLSNVFLKYPGLKKGNNPNNTQVIFGTPDRAKRAGNNQLEYWPADETGTADYPHPSPGKTTLELYNPKFRTDKNYLETAIYGDLLHGMKNDPEYGKMRKEFSDNFRPEAIEMDKRQNIPMNDSRMDEYIRGYLTDDPTDEFLQAHKAGKPVYSPKQIELLNKMKGYISKPDSSVIPKYEIEPPDPTIGTPAMPSAPILKEAPLTSPSKSYLAETLPASPLQSAEEDEAGRSLTDFQEGTKNLGKLGGEFIKATAKTFDPSRIGNPPSTEELGKIWEPERIAGEKAGPALDVVSNAAQLALAGDLAYRSVRAIPEAIDYFAKAPGMAGDWIRSKLATIAGGKFNPTSGGEMVPATEEALADLYAKAPVSVQEELRQAARTNDTLRGAIGRVHGFESASATPPRATSVPIAPPTSVITPQDLPSANLVDAVKQTQGDMANFAIPGQAPQIGTERMMLVAKKMAETLNLTPANIQAAMDDSLKAYQSALEAGVVPDQAQTALNAAFFKRIPLLASGIPQDMAEGLKAGDPMMVDAYMRQILSDQPVLQEALPTPVPAKQLVPDPTALSKPEGVPPAPVPPSEPIATPEPEPPSPQFEIEPPPKRILRRASGGPKGIAHAIRSNGGINPTLGESSDILEFSRPDLVNRRSGQSADGMLESLKETGYLPKDALIRDMYDALDTEIKTGKKHIATDDHEFPEQPIDTYSPEKLQEEINAIHQKLADEGKISKADQVRLKEMNEIQSRMTDFHFGDNVSEPSAQYGKVPAFYSGLQSLIQSKMPNKAPVDQVRAIIASGKKDEIDWSGINEFLDGKTTVTKQEVMDFLKTNEVQLKEVVKGENEKAYTMDQIKKMSPDEIAQLYREKGLSDRVVYAQEQRLLQHDPDAYEVALQRLNEGINNSTKFSNYQLPGGENYREMLLTLPVSDKLSATKEISDNVGGTVRTGTGFRSGHFDEPNILAHVRFNDRTDAEGNKILFLEEVQSDWHQKGREKGYAGSNADNSARLAEIERESNSISKELASHHASNEALEKYFTPGRIVKGYGGWDRVIKFHPSNEKYGWSVDVQEVKKDGTVIPDARIRNHATIPDPVEMFPERTQLLNKLRDLEHENFKLQKKDVVPDAPFKKTWHELALKRMLRYAAENGYDKLAWTTGDQQAERYDLSKHLDAVEYQRVDKAIGEESYKIDMRLNDGSRSRVPKIVPKDELADYVGKDLAEKIVNSKEDKGMFHGLDLKVGGEGMKGFYDKMIPSFLNKYAKKWGGKVGETEIPDTGKPGKATLMEGGSGGEYYVRNEENDMLYHGDNIREAQRIFNAYNSGEIQEKSLVHSLEITPSMRKDVLERGQSLFEPKPPEQFGLPGMPQPEMLTKGLQPKAPQVDEDMLLAGLKKAKEVQGDLPLEADLAKPMEEPGPTPSLVTNSNVNTKLEETGHLEFTSLTYDGPETAAGALYHLKNDTNENVYFILLDQANKIIGVDHNSIGTLTSSDVNYGRILGIAKKAGAVKIIPVHNHPSGNVKASEDDIKSTMFLRAQAKDLGIAVGEHVIIDHGEFGVISEDNVPSIQKFVEPQNKPFQVRILKLAQERELQGAYQGLKVKHGMIAAEVMKDLVDKNKNTLFAMVLDNQLKINAISPIATGTKFGTNIVASIADAVINHAGAHVVLAAHQALSTDLIQAVAAKLKVMGVSLKDMIFPDAAFTDYTSMAETSPEYFPKVRESEETPAFQEKEKREKKILIEEIKGAINEKLLSAVSVSRIRRSLNIGAMKTADLSSLQKLKDFIGTLKAGDTFLSDNQLAGLRDILKGLDRPDLTPKRVIVDTFGDKQALLPNGILGKIANELIPTVDIKEGHPLIAKVVNNAENLMDRATEETRRRDDNFDKMISKAESARADKLSPLEKMKRRIAPQNKEIFQALSGMKVNLTKEEAGVVAYLKNFFEKARRDLELDKYRKNYVTHMEKPLLEKILTEGLAEAVSGIFDMERPLNIPVNVMLELDNIIGGKKFFKYALERKGYGKPTTNLRKILHTYSNLYETKKALDQILPEGQAVTKILLEGRSAKWMKQFLQNLKGRGLDFDFRTGKMAWLAKLADNIISVGYFKLLGLNYMSALKNVAAGESNSFVFQGIIPYLTGKQRFFTNFKKVNEMAKEYGVFEGTYTDYSNQGIDKLKKAGGLLLIGQKWGEIEIRGALFAGELTNHEWETGHVTPERARAIKDTIAITQGIFSKTESPLFVQTWYGRTLMQMNRWRITNAMMFRRFAAGAHEEVKREVKNGPNMQRLARMFVVYGLGMYFSYELGKAGKKKASQIAASFAESLNSIVELMTLAPIVKSIRDNPTMSILAEFAYTIQELAAYIGVPGANEPKKIEFKHGIENTNIVGVNNVKEAFGIKKPPKRYNPFKSNIPGLGRKLEKSFR